MLRVLLVMVGFLVSSCSTTNPRGPSGDLTGSISKPRHFVITIHGVRGNDVTFGDFHSIVKVNLPAIDPHFEVVPVNWTYPVGKAVDNEQEHFAWEPHTIADRFNREMFLNSDAELKTLQPNDKISLVAYSMGGLMAMTWYYDTMFNFENAPALKAKYASPEYQKGLPTLHQALSQVENIIGLGAVYWGSLEAEFGWSIFEKGELHEAARAIPKVKAACQSAALSNIVSGTSLLGEAWRVATRANAKSTTAENQDRFISSLVAGMCGSVQNMPDVVANNFDALVPDKVVRDFRLAIRDYGNLHSSELDNMRLTSEPINSMRIGRIKHMQNPELRVKYPVRWTSIVGVFPCLGKVGDDQSCQNFSNPKYKDLNTTLTTIFSGNLRRETDGAVASPNTIADFIYYTERPDQDGGKLKSVITQADFHNTADLDVHAAAAQPGRKSLNQEVFVENMHATLSPALEAIGSIGQSINADILNFDKSLGQDVAIINKECEDSQTCKHPNYKYILQTLSGCEAGSTAPCNQDLVDQFFGVSGGNSNRMGASQLLRSQMGSYILNFNIRLPADFNPKGTSAHKLLKNFEILGMHAGSGRADKAYSENRVDKSTDPFLHQIGRSSEIISSYATLDQRNHILRVFYIGRAFPKRGQESQARAILNAGVPVTIKVNLPGLKSRTVQALVKPTYTTYVDMFMQR
ncbi:MAG: hypothetical protein JNM39_07220 [Bdellovibrionaceae bacterium]|nr:hypothetical protein [Pseudobdellovibrionaceae bacterium]